MKRHFFTTCSECGNDRPNYSGICNDCAPLYRTEPMIDDACRCIACRSDLARIAPCEKEQPL